MSISIPKADPVIIDPAITAPAVGNTFACEPRTAESDFSALFQPTGTVTTITASLQISLDGGTTFVDLITSANFFPTVAQLARVVTPFMNGALYRINYTAASGSIVMRVCIN